MQRDNWRTSKWLLDLLTASILLTIYLAGAWAIIFKPPLIWVDHIYDDAYYYLGVVRSLTEGRGSQFLPPFVTNGYQPLWTLILWLTASLAGTSEQSLALQIYTYSFAGAFAFAALAKRYYGNSFLAIAYLLSFPYISLLGMETCLIPPLFLIFLRSSNWISRGCLGSLIFLSRLDALAIVISRDVISIIQKEKRDHRHYIIIAPVLAAYFIFNFKQFGTPVPISGLAKSVGNVIGENWGAALQYLINMRYAALLLLIALTIKFATSTRTLPFKTELQTLGLSLLMCMAYYSLKSGWPIWGWYPWAAFLLTFFLAQGIVQSFSSPESQFTWRSPAWKFVIGAGAGLSICYSFIPGLTFVKEQIHLFNEARADRIDNETFGRKNIALAQHFHRQQTPHDTMFAMGDRAGSFGFFLGNDMQFMHTEGLVGPLNYLVAMQKDQGKAYIESLPIAYFIADREQYLRQDGIIGVTEPNQGLSAHTGPYLLCFPESSIILDQSYGINKRYVFDFKKRVPCPSSLEKSFLNQRNAYQGIRKFSQPTRYGTDNLLSKLLHRHIDIP